LTHACIPFFSLTDVGQVAHPTACLGALVEPVCRGGRPGLPLTIGSPGLPLYLLLLCSLQATSCMPLCTYGGLFSLHMHCSTPSPSLLGRLKFLCTRLPIWRVYCTHAYNFFIFWVCGKSSFSKTFFVCLFVHLLLPLFPLL
jgi:hypothetical protein